MTAVAAGPGPVVRTAPATLGQRAQWFEEQETPAERRHLHNIHQWWHLPAPAKPTAVEAALAALVARHEGLRTTLVGDRADTLVQRVHAAAPPPLATTTLADVRSQRRPAVAVLASTPIDLAAEWPVRFGLVLDDAGLVCQVLAVVHHSAIDAMSRPIAADDFQALLADPDALPPPGPQPCDIAEAEQTPKGLAAQRRSLEYLRGRLLTVPTSLFPADADAGPSDLFGKRERDMAQVDVGSAAVANACRRLKARSGLPAAPLLLAAYATGLAGRTGHDVLPVKTMVANRFDAATRGVVACLSQPMLAVVAVRREASLLDNAAACHGALLRAYRHGKYDISALRGLMDEVAAVRGPVHLDRLVDILDRRPGLDQHPVDPAALAERPSVTVAGPRRRHGGEQVFRVRAGRSRADISLLFDTRCLSIEDATSLVLDVVDILVAAVR